MTDSTPEITKIADVNIGDFVRFSSKDDSGYFSHVGEVISINKETKKQDAYFEMLTFDGVMGFILPEKIDESVSLKICNTKPTGWAKFKKNPQSFKTKPEEKVVEPVKTVREQVFDLVSNNKRKSKKSLLKLAKSEIKADINQLESYIDLALAKI